MDRADVTLGFLLAYIVAVALHAALAAAIQRRDYRSAEVRVLALFFQLFATFERIYRRRAPSLRAAITSHVHRHRRTYVPLVYLGIVLAAGVYVVDATGVGNWLDTVRHHVGPTSAYLFGGTLLFMTFVLFPARPGQEKIPVPTLGRAALLLSAVHAELDLPRHLVRRKVLTSVRADLFDREVGPRLEHDERFHRLTAFFVG